jgi:hypothetical protein
MFMGITRAAMLNLCHGFGPDVHVPPRYLWGYNRLEVTLRHEYDIQTFNITKQRMARSAVSCLRNQGQNPRLVTQSLGPWVEWGECGVTCHKGHFDVNFKVIIIVYQTGTCLSELALGVPPGDVCAHNKAI